MKTSVVWFRRDLRLGDHPALTAAAASADRVLPVLVLDPALQSASQRRTDRLLASASALRTDTGGALVVRSGDPAQVIPEITAQVGAGEVHVSAETTPYGRRRDNRIARRLAAGGVLLVATGSPYAVTPGRIGNGSGAPYRVFAPFFKAWREHGWRDPLPAPEVTWLMGVRSEHIRAQDRHEQVGERAALDRWEEFCAHDLADYATDRDRSDLDSTSRMSIHLKYGEVHPRTLLVDLAHRSPGEESAGTGRFMAELAWREFYADVLWHAPESAWRDWRSDLRAMPYDSDEELLEAWRAGRTGYPFVDAGMRQLLAEGWLHNRVRMVAASFLVKDLHMWWPIGARHFLAQLLDGDIASNSHGWQWTAGTGTDAAPYFRVFNPITQGLRFDPDGDYVRRWVPELRHLAGAAAHEPWRHGDGYRHGYPGPVVQHARERREALARYRAAKQVA